MHDHRHPAPPLARLASLSATLWLLAAAGCVGPDAAPDPAGAWTPSRHVEHRLLFARPDPADVNRLSLRHGYEARTPADRALEILPGDPVSVVVNDVYLPRDGAGPRDVVLLLDLHAGAGRPPESYAVWYQRNVRGGQKLGFDSLLVHSERAWSPVNPPRFTLRVIDVTAERNAATRRVFEQLEDSVGGLSSFVPHPAAGGAAAAIRAAGFVLASRANTTIIDFSPQFYAGEFIERAGPNDLPPFMQGTWLVVGREPLARDDASFWRRDLVLDRRSGTIAARESPDLALGCPYVRLTIAAVDAAVPRVVLDHSQTLYQALSNPSPSPELLRAASREMVSSLMAFGVHKRFLSSRTMGTLGELFSTLEDTGLTEGDRAFLLRVASKVAGAPFTTTADASEWWRTTGARGHIDAADGTWRP